MNDHYHILGVPPEATDEEIRAAFKKLAVIYHPDKNPDNPEMEERFKEINEAYQVLSNPYRKARYDLLRNYGAAEPEPQYTYPQPPPPQYRRAYAEPTVDHEENWKATLYAFGFTFVVALIVMSFIGIKSFYDSVKEEERLAKRENVYKRAQIFYKSGNLDSTFLLMNGLGGIDPEQETDMLVFKDALITSTRNQGADNYLNGNYSKAIYFLEILDKYTDIKELSLKESLALAYRETGQMKEAIHVFTQLLMRNYKRLYVFVQLAEIYRDEIGDYEKALFYFERGNESAKNYYEAIYGKAYNVILTGNMLPEDHFKLYTGLAEIYLRLNQPESAISVTEWNKQVWPDRSDNFLIAAEGYRQLGVEQAAQEELDKFFLR